MRKYTILLLLSLFCSLTASAQDPCALVSRVIGEAEMMVMEGDYEKALKLLRACAKDPDTQGCKNLAFLKKKITEIEAQFSGPAKETITVNGVSFVMVRVKGGTFTMGATSEQGSDARDWEKPTHKVTLSDYYIGETEVTQALWLAVMGNNPSHYKGDNRPVHSVSWEDCQAFIAKLNQLTGRNFRLPTEAEWEYAARGGISEGNKYAGSANIDAVAWYDKNVYWKIDSSSPDYGPQPIKTKQPNELGLYDMSGNVREWCNDWYKGNYYSSSPQTNPQGPLSGSYRVNRGGYWSCNTEGCRVAYRSCNSPGDIRNDLGLRLGL